VTVRFIGFATPRSGTAWLSNFLTYGQEVFCRHEALFGCENLTDYNDSIERLSTPVRGSIDTAAGLVAKGMSERFEKTHRFFVIVREGADVSASLAACHMNDSSLNTIYHGLLWLIREYPAIPVIQYRNLFKLNTLRELWSYLEIPAPFPVQRFEMLTELLVEDGRIKGFGRFVTSDGCRSAIDNFQTLFDSVKPVFPPMNEPSRPIM